MNPYVKSIRPLSDFRLQILFEDGEYRVFDLKPYLERGCFRRLKNPNLFKAARVVAGSVEWPGGLDLSYDTLHLESCPEPQPGIPSAATETVAAETLQGVRSPKMEDYELDITREK